MKSTLPLIITAFFCFGIGCAVSLICVAIDHSRSPAVDRYEFHTGEDGRILWICDKSNGFISTLTNGFGSDTYGLYNSPDTMPILLNRTTGETWRYYHNETNSESYPLEGFVPLSHGTPIYYGSSVLSNAYSGSITVRTNNLPPWTIDTLKSNQVLNTTP